MRFGGLVAINDLSLRRAARRDHRADRPERRRQDHGLQLHHRLLQADRRPDRAAKRRSRRLGAISTADRQRGAQPERRGGSLFLLERMPDYLVAKQARVARTFQNIRLFRGMTVLENLLVAQHNPLMLASGFTVLGILGLGGFTRAQNAAIDKARYWLDTDRPDRSRRRSRRRPALWRPAPARNRARHVHRSGAALPRRAGRRPQPARKRRAQRLLISIRDRPRDLDPADRARHVGGDADFRPRRRARLRRQDRRRHAASSSQRSERHRRLSRRRGGRGRDRSRRRSGCERQPRRLPRRSAGVKTYYGNIIALRGVDLDVHEGEIVTLIGANGAGKSTLMMTIFGNPRAREGQILFEGRDITQLPTHEIARLRHRPVAGRPAHLPAHDRDGKSADGRGVDRQQRISTKTSSASSTCSRA